MRRNLQAGQASREPEILAGLRKTETCIVAGAAIPLWLAGCQSGPPPVGPGAAASADLRPWLKAARQVTFTGRLQYSHCTSEHGSYFTWSLDPAGDDDA